MTTPRVVIVVSGGNLKTCYIDESGDGSSITLSSIPRVTPVFSMIGLIINSESLISISREYIEIKMKFFPNLTASRFHPHWGLREIKGSNLAKTIRKNSKREKRQTIGFLDHTLKLLEKNEVKIVGRIWIKEINGNFNEKSVYSSSLQSIYAYFENLLDQESVNGMVICDNRSEGQNLPTSHSIYTQKL